MFTFDTNLNPDNSEFKAMLKGAPPVENLVECGENNEVWFRVNRTTKNLELVCKVTGKITKKCLLSDVIYPHIYGMTAQQLGAAHAALALRKSDATVKP